MIVLPILISFAISAGIGPFVIKEMRRLKAAQTERTEGVESHLKKAGTPTMGGLMILAGIIITSLIFLRGRKEILPVLFLTVSFGVIGFLDDYLKVVLRRSDGLLPRQKLILQFGATIVFWLILRGLGISLELMLPFGGGRLYDIGWFAVPLMFTGFFRYNDMAFEQFALEVIRFHTSPQQRIYSYEPPFMELRNGYISEELNAQIELVKARKKRFFKRK